MTPLRRLAGSLAFQVAAIVLLGLVAVQVAMVAAVIWPEGRMLAFRTVSPAELEAMASAIESAPPERQPALLAALGHSGVRVALLPDFPETVSPGASTPGMSRTGQQALRRFADALGPREIRAEAGELDLLGLDGSAESDAGPVRLLVSLRTGQVLALERSPVVLRRFARRYALVASAAAATMFLLGLLLLWQVVRPLNVLARSTRSFGTGTSTERIIPAGAREVRELGAAFNALQTRIAGLVEERTRMLAAVAHDLRTYLTRLRLRADYIDHADQRDRAVRDLQEMSQLLDDILLFARDDAAPRGTPPLIDATAEARAVVERRREWGEAVVLTLREEPLHCHCSPLALRRMLDNLIDNAVRYGGSANVTLAPDCDLLSIVIEDEGPGVAAAEIDRLTEPFTRLEPSRGRKTGGAGLGLAIVKALAEANGGRLGLSNGASGGLRATIHIGSAGR